MASFTDAISQFNPYVQQLSVDAMAKVGMYKQQQYDQGVQKVQSYIDNVSGLSVSDKHKPYLQSKLNQLGNNLKYVAAGDFSNQQVVNSVGGMATQLVADPVIQNAVSSTQLLRKGMNDVEDARKAGKLHKNNEDFFNSQINDWMSDGNLNSTFRGKYTQYTDYTKKEIELAKEIDKIEKSVELHYMRDGQGRTLYFDAKGNRSLDPTKGRAREDLTMQTITAKGKPAEKILALFESTFDDNDEQQMRIDSWAKYKGKGIETFQGDIDKGFQLVEKMLQQESTNLAVALNDSNINSSDKLKIEARLNDVNEQIKNGTIGKQKTALIEGLKNPNALENYKYEVFKKKHLYELADNLSTQSFTYATTANPALQMQNELKKIQMTADQNRISNQQWQATYAAGRDDEMYKRGRDAKADTLLAPKVTSGFISTEKEIPTLAKYDEQRVATQTAINQLNAESAQALPGISTLTSGPARQKALDNLYNNYTTNPKEKISNDVRDYVETRRMLENKKARQNTLYNEVSKGSQAITKQLDDSLSKELGVYTTGGVQIASAKDLQEVRAAYGAAFKTSGYGEDSVQRFDAKEFMNRFKGTPKERIAQAYYKEQTKTPLTPLDNAFIKRGRELSTKYRDLSGEINQKRFNYEKESLLKYDVTRQTQVGTINPQNKADEASISQLLGNKFDAYNTVGAMDTETKEKFDPAVITGMRTGKGAANLSYTIVKNYSGSAELIISDGTQTQTVPMTASEVTTYFPSAANAHPLEEAKSAIEQSITRTTNSRGDRGVSAGAVGAMYSGYDLPQLKNTAQAPLVRFDIEGRMANNGSKDDRYQLLMYVCDKNGVWHSGYLNAAGYKTLDDIELVKNNIGTTTYNEILKK